MPPPETLGSPYLLHFPLRLHLHSILHSLCFSSLCLRKSVCCFSLLLFLLFFFFFFFHFGHLQPSFCLVRLVHLEISLWTRDRYCRPSLPSHLPSRHSLDRLLVSLSSTCYDCYPCYSSLFSSPVLSPHPTRRRSVHSRSPE